MNALSVQPTSHGDMIAFLDKLAKFHETLPPGEKAILDQMTAAALNAPQGDVQGFGSNLPTLGGAFGNQQLLAKPYYKPYYNSVTSLIGRQL